MTEPLSPSDAMSRVERVEEACRLLRAAPTVETVDERLSALVTLLQNLPALAAECEADGDPAVCTAVRRAAGVLRRSLGDPVKGLQRITTMVLEDTAPHAPWVAELLEHVLADNDPQTAWAAAFTLARLRRFSEPVGRALLAALSHPDGDIRWAASAALADMHASFPSVLAGVQQAATGPHPKAREMAAFCLGKIGRCRPADESIGVDAPVAPVEPHLLQLLGDPELAVRRAAVIALGKTPPLSDSARSAIERLAAEDADERVRRTAAAVLQRTPS